MNRRQAAGLGGAAGLLGGALSYLVLRGYDFPFLESVVLAAINAFCCGLTDAIVASMVVARIDIRFKPGPLSARILSSICFGGPAGFIGGGFVGFFIGSITGLFIPPGSELSWLLLFVPILGAPTAGVVGLVVGGICGAMAKPRTVRK